MGDLTSRCRERFGLEPHQVRYLLETFTSPSIAEDFQLHTVKVSQWRRALGCKRMPAVPRRINSAPSVHRYFPSPLLAPMF